MTQVKSGGQITFSLPYTCYTKDKKRRHHLLHSEFLWYIYCVQQGTMKEPSASLWDLFILFRFGLLAEPMLCYPVGQCNEVRKPSVIICCLSSMVGYLPSKCLPSKDAFHCLVYSIEGHLSLKLVFCWSLSIIKVYVVRKVP